MKKYVRIAHVADAHYGLGYPGPNPEARLEDIERAMNAAADKIIAERTDLCIFAGDAFRDAKIMLDRARREVVSFAGWLKRLSDAGVAVVAVSGTPSHDSRSAWEFLRDMALPNVHIVLEPGRVDVAGVRLVCIPGLDRRYLRDADVERTPEEQALALGKILSNLMRNLHPDSGMEPGGTGPCVLVAHQLCDRARGGSEAGAQKRMEFPTEITNFTRLAGRFEPVLSTTEADRYDLTCLGHIHVPQRCSERVFYAGSPERLSFGDEGVETGFWLHDLPISGEEKAVHTFFPTAARPYVTLKFDPRTGLMAGDEKLIRGRATDENISLSLREVLPSLPKNALSRAIVRLRAVMEDREFRTFPRSRIEEMLYELGAGFVQTIETVCLSKEDERKRQQDEEEGVDWFSPSEALAAWGRKRGVEEERIAVLVRAAEILQAPGA